MNNQKTEQIPVFFTIDNSYAAYLGVALQSLTENASDAYQYQIIIIEEDLSEENRKKLLRYQSDRFQISFVGRKEKWERQLAPAAKKTEPETVEPDAQECSDAHETADRESALASVITNREENRLRCDYFTMTIYERLFIADLFPEYDKAIYLDSDIVVPGDISEFWSVDLKDHLVGACIDGAVAADAALSGYAAGAVGVPPTEYVNSGILLMNLKKLREEKFSDRFLTLLDTYHFYCIAPDQDYLNAICQGRIHYLNGEWDVMPDNHRPALANPKLIHYNLFEKPWCYDGIQYESYFWDYARKTPWYEELLQFKANYSEEQKASDRSCMEEMIQKAQEVPDMEVTFRKVQENGGNVRL